MRYISKAQREKERWQQFATLWMTLIEAITHIRRLTKCSEEDALSQLRDAIGEEAVKIRWGDLPIYDDDLFFWLGIADLEDSWKHPKFRTPSGVTFWCETPICLKDSGSVLDDTTDYYRLALQDPDTIARKPEEMDAKIKAKAKEMREARIASGEVKYRPVALLRSSIFAIWPEEPTLSGAAGSSLPQESALHSSPSNGLTPHEPVVPEATSRTSDVAVHNAAKKLYESADPNPPNKRIAEQQIRAMVPGATRKRIRPVLNDPKFKRRSPGRPPKH